MDIITARQLTRQYGRRVGVENVNLTIGEGEIFGFLGPNGAGKTTTIRMLLGFLRPTRGQATICGLDCWAHSARIKHQVGYLPGDLRLYSWITGNIAIKLAGLLRGLDLYRAGAELAERFQLEMDLRVRKMSRGMRQKLGLILALVHKPPLLVLDEPTSGLDPLMQAELTTCLRERAAAGHTVFFSSHTLSEVEVLCDRVAIVRHGRIVADESLQSMRSRARRTVELVFPDDETAKRVEFPHFLKNPKLLGRQLTCELDGPAPPLIAWAAHQPLEDIHIGHPDLESLFRAFYDAPPEHR